MLGLCCPLIKAHVQTPVRDHKLGGLQNSPGNSQWLSLGSKTASFSWKQILLASRICLFLKKKSVIGRWDRLTHWKCIPDNSVFRGQVGGVPASRATGGLAHATHPLLAALELHRLHLLRGFWCFEVWTELSSGANCMGPWPWTWVPHWVSLLLQVDVLLQERLGAPPGWGLRCGSFRGTFSWFGVDGLSPLLI